MHALTCLTIPIDTVAESAPLESIRELLLEHDAPAVAVVDPSAALCGVITSTDLLQARADWTAADAMSTALAVRVSTSIPAVADLMAREHAPYAIVTDAFGQVIGVVTAREIARQLAKA